MRLLLLSLVTLSVMFCGRLSFADDDGASERVLTEAQACFQAGVSAYKDENYRAAIKHFQDGYDLRPRPAFLLNIAQAYRRLGELAQARSFYVRFVEAVPSSDPARASAVKIVERLEQELATQTQLQASAPAHPAEEPLSPAIASAPAQPTATDKPMAVAQRTTRRWYRDPVAGVLLGLGLGGAGVGAALVAYSATLDGRAMQDLDAFVADQRAPTLRIAGIVTLCAGGALLLGAGLRYSLESRRH